MNRGYKTFLDLKSICWREFKVGDVFSVTTGALVPKKILKEGFIPRITATENNNGIFGFYQDINHKHYRALSNFISVSFLGSCFYHPYKASLDMKIHALQIKGKDLNRHLSSFLLVALKQMTSVFSYGYQLSSTDLSKKTILLPVDSKGVPDYGFMESYIKSIERRNLDSHLAYLSRRLDKLGGLIGPIKSLIAKDFREFEISEIFIIKPGKRLTKSDMKKGQTPFVGSSDSNNGITGFISNTNVSEDSSVLGVNYNGSVVENFYHPYKALFSDDVKRFSLRNGLGNEFIYLFIKTAILKQKSKYMYGYKFNEHRMNRQKIMLPVNDKGEPDYEYMENYIKRIEYLKLKEYIEQKKFSLSV